MEKQAFALIVQNKWYEITAVHVFHDREKAQKEMVAEVEEAREEAVRKGYDYVQEAEIGDGEARLSWGGGCYTWQIVEDIDYEVNNP